MPSSKTPILVLGTARSGTTWLTNLLLSYSGVSGIAHPLHWGAHEVPLFQMERYWGSLRSPRNYLRFVHATTATDLWQLGGDDLDYWLRNPTPGVSEWFLEFMDRFAERHGTRYWAAKLDPRLMSDRKAWIAFRRLLLQRYPDVCAVGIVRRRDDVLQSYRHMPGRYYRRRTSAFGSLSATALGLARYRYQNDNRARVLRELEGVLVDFDALAASVPQAMAPIESRLPDLGERAEPAWPRNTSFRTPERETFKLGLVGEAVDRVFAQWPGLGGVLLRSWDRVRGVSDPASTRLLQARCFPEELEAEFRQTGLDALIPYISPSRVLSETGGPSRNASEQAHDPA